MLFGLFQDPRDRWLDYYKKDPFTISIDEKSYKVIAGGEVCDKCFEPSHKVTGSMMVGCCVMSTHRTIPDKWIVRIRVFDGKEYKYRNHTVSIEDYGRIKIGDKIKFEYTIE